LTNEKSALVERAAALRPILERNAETTDVLRRLADENVQALKDAGLCRLMVPARLGGHQTSVRTYIDVMAELGRGCGSTSWVASLINVCAWLASLFPERAQADIWAANRDAWIGRVTRAKRRDGAGRWRVAGQRAMAVGLGLDARAVGRCGIHMKNDRGEMTNLGLSLMPIEELDVEDTWFMAGMKGTGSNTIVAKDVFVPEHRFLPYPQAFGGELSNGAHRRSGVSRGVRADHGPHSRAVSARRGSLSARARDRQIDIARHHAHELRRSKPTSAGFQMQIAEAAMKIDTAFLHARRAADDLDRYAQDNRLMDVTARARVRMDTALAAKYCRDAVEILVAAHGTSSLADSNRMQRLWRDVHTASHHAITEWQVNLEVYGKALLGVEPNITHLI
jgi:alkylation response protein AidB-like acyl-CoA dehydrogenase